MKECVEVCITPEAWMRITEAVMHADNGFEVGGTLLGYRSEGTMKVHAVTVPETICGKRGRFCLNGEQESIRASAVAEQYKPQLVLLGVWHSHAWGSNSFSEQDKCAHCFLAQQLQGALSFLICGPNERGEIKLLASYLSGKEEEYVVDVQLNCGNRSSMTLKLRTRGE